MQPETVTVLALGFFLGVKHALDADHLIAVATIVSERKRIFSSTLVGTLWGIGHTAALLAIGCCVVAFGLHIPESLAMGMEFLVAAMLIILGLNVLWKLMKGETVHVHVHSHHGKKHVHLHSHPTAHEHAHTEGEPHHRTWTARLLEKALTHWAESKQSLLIGMVHGLAGSAALMLIVLATIPQPMLALAYIGVFGIGSIGGMIVMSTLLGIPFALTGHRSLTINRIIRGGAGGASVAFGIFLAWQIGVVEGLLIP